ncbi:hypothetical protein NY2A_b028L [Paramecium bursaria Chlorella virus NY2A]|uniref:Uncharacterized protein b028L n=1 Tax=Paramecium bursaria Chlorella virus NY2A TaxID=46021 RepID=A7IVQ3_PBCVN|nr:hypothetical protein NY2A_b028L [Paramecium bursaria Chlorella virus NY2A]ABT14427.1 hypothetical protein NY2A_b028L [Paramecium bursaria Chlorella virus NY2A]
MIVHHRISRLSSAQVSVEWFLFASLSVCLCASGRGTRPSTIHLSIHSVRQRLSMNNNLSRLLLSSIVHKPCREMITLL